MQINIGDRVKFLNDIGGGTVTRILDEKTVLVLSENDDFEIPVLKKELIVSKTSSLPSKESNEQESGLLTSISKTISEQKNDILFAFVPKEEMITESSLSVFLINDSNYILLYSFYEIKDGESYEGIAAGKLDSHSKVVLKEYSNEQARKLSSYFFHFILFKKGKYHYQKPIEKELIISPEKFSKTNSFKTNHYLTQKAILYKLIDIELKQKMKKVSSDELRKVIYEKEKPISKPKRIFKSSQNNDRIIEIDLHINALLDSVVGLSNFEILEFQLNKFNEILQKYKNKKGQRIVFIHGIGNGTLKQKIREELRRKYTRYQQQDASFKEYGWGATLVTIR